MASEMNSSSLADRQCFENGTVLLSIPSSSEHNLTLRNASGVHPLGSCWYEGYCYYINCSTWNGPPELTVPIYGYIMPFILAVTFLSNILIIIVLSKKQMRSPTNLVLMSMAISDLLTVIFPAPWYFYIYTMGNVETFNNKETGYAYETMLETMPQIFHTASIWLTLALALQRYIYVCHAPIARVWCTMEKTKRAISGIFFVAFLHQTTRFFDKKFEDLTIEYPVCSNNYIDICKVSFADWVVHDVSLNGYFITFWWFRVLFVHLIPCVSLVILNILLFRTMKQAEKKRERLLHCKQKAASKGETKESRKLRDSNCTTLMLIVVITVFLAVELPLGIITILHTMSSTIYDFLDYGFVKSIVLIVNLCICLSYPLNFGIYCGMSRQFRETFKELFMQRVTMGFGAPHNNNNNNMNHVNHANTGRNIASAQNSRPEAKKGNNKKNGDGCELHKMPNSRALVDSSRISVKKEEEASTQTPPLPNTEEETNPAGTKYTLTVNGTMTQQIIENLDVTQV